MARMTAKRFWEIIDEACQGNPYLAEEWDTRLIEKLGELSGTEILAWNHLLDHCAAAAYRVDLWAAAYLINGGASDDGFYYFRLWLIGLGKAVYDAAILDPDSLAKVADPDWFAAGVEAEAEIYAAAHIAWMQVTGEPETAPYPARNETANLVGSFDDFNFDDDDLMRERLPKLAAIYLDSTS